ncbi:hypothetical protein [Variovorax sp. MHTC-1]|uniref:hypothetical protein n=1 Tax=Variovorax sp. MHTC-1 TaxID=2495593 RepID=UPI000F882876|nr:hypothetical protein [Variovorax sp. MHTC-1]RST48691.1 hypothetical protein EJI01_25635 [Variovorax sp. MHTC-1]
MNDTHVYPSLEEGVLRLYRHAVAERRWEVAECLMCALEQLAKAEPDCEASVEQGYLCIGGRRHHFNF